MKEENKSTLEEKAARLDDENLTAVSGGGVIHKGPAHYCHTCNKVLDSNEEFEAHFKSGHNVS